MSFLTRSAGVLLVCLTSLLTIPAADAAAVRAAAPSGNFSGIAGCMSGADNVLVSVVVDESLSLRKTDPQALRVQGITTAVDSLEQLTSTLKDSTRVEVSMSTFARRYSTLVGWRQLTPSTGQKLRSTAQKILPARDAGDATDYRQALLGAKRQLDSRQRAIGDPQACKLLLWFTDGALDVDSQTAVASEELCQRGGIADAVRDDGINVVALALFKPGSGVTQAQRDQLRAVAEGSAGPTKCGTVPVPLDNAGGVYLPAADAASLQRLFAQAGALVAGGTQVGTVHCPGSGCVDGDFPLGVDPGIAGARVLVRTAGDPQVRLNSPSGHEVRLVPGQTTRADGAQVSYLVRDHLATINLAYTPYSSRHVVWTVHTDGPADLDAYWFWGATLKPLTTELAAGAPSRVTFQLQDQDGAPLPLALYSAATASIQVGGQDLPARVTPRGVVSAALDLGVKDLPSAMDVTASFKARSTPGRVLLGPISTSRQVPVALPPSYPTVAPKELDFGRLEGLGTATANLQLTGSKLGPTEVCVSGASVTLPGGSTRTHLLSPEHKCTKLAAGEQRTLPLRLSPDKSVDGLVKGKVSLRLSSADGSADLELGVPLHMEMQRPVDESTRWELIAALLALALLVPVLLLVGSNLLLARFMLTSTSRTATRPVRVTPAGLARRDGSSLLEPEDFENAGFSGTRKGGRLSLGGTGLTLRARRIFSLKEPLGYAAAAPGDWVVSSLIPYRSSKPNEAPTAFGAVDAAFVVVSSAGATAEQADGTLVMVVPGDVDAQGIRDRAARLGAGPEWASLLSDMAQADESPSKIRPRASAAAPTTQASAPDSSRDDDFDAPPVPWDTRSTRQEPEPVASGRRGRGRRSESPPPPDHMTDDQLPPLPDFLR